MAAAGIAARARHFLHDHARLGEREAGAAELLRDEGRHPAGPGQGVDELLGVDALLVDLLPIGRVELLAELGDRLAKPGMVVASEVHVFGVRWAWASSSVRSQTCARRSPSSAS